MKKILTEAVAVGNATARALSFKPRSDTVYIYDDGSWYTAFDGGDYRWLIDDGKQLHRRRAAGAPFLCPAWPGSMGASKLHQPANFD